MKEADKLPLGCRRIPGSFKDGLARYVFTTKIGEGLLHDHSKGCITLGQAEAHAASMRSAGCACGFCDEPIGKPS